MSEFAGNLLRIFISFRNLERRNQLQEEEQTKRNQRKQDFPPIVCPNRIEVPETCTSPEKTLAVLQGTNASKQAVSKGAVDLGEKSRRSDDGLSVSD